MRMELLCFDFVVIGCLSFEWFDESCFLCLFLVKVVFRVGGVMFMILNVVNEIVVEVYMVGVIGFYDIFEMVERVCLIFFGRCILMLVIVVEVLVID